MATGLFNLKQVNQAISQGAWSGYIAPRWVEYLVSAGGGGAGSGNSGGGGGGGGFLTGIVTVVAGTSYTVTVGAGGSGGVSGSGSNGANSLFGAISATGGGYGGGNVTGGAGGSGGGGGGDITTVGGQGIANQGNAGGRGANTTGTYAFVSGGGVFAGGGGGAGTVGGTYSIGPAGISGNGGAGIASAITGTATLYSGGGGGGGDGRSAGGKAGVGGVGGGGNGSLLIAGGAGTANTGGGGGGGGYNPSTFYDGGAGGSGIVVVRYPGNVQFFTGGTVNYNNGYIIHIFTSSGTLAPTTPTPYSTSYQIERSLRFNSADTAYLVRAPATTTNRRTFTWSGWVKRSEITSYQTVFSANDNTFVIGFWGDQQLIVFFDVGAYAVNAANLCRDPSAWYHIVVGIDTTQATDSNRVKMYINGTQVTSFLSTPTYPPQNFDTAVNQASSNHRISAGPTYASNFFGGYQTEIYLIDGQQLTPSSFGATSTTTGVWSPIQYTGTYGTNGFYVNFSDNSNNTATTLGKDYSGNGNNFTPTNLSVTAGAGNDSMVDSPTQYGFDTGVGGTVRGNYATLNPLVVFGTSAFTNGNLDVSVSSANTNNFATIAIPTSGKWYWEYQITSVGGGAFPMAGIIATGSSALTSNVVYRTNGDKNVDGTGSAYGATYTTTDIIGVAVDTDGGTVTFYKNGSSQGAITYATSSGNYSPALRSNAATDNFTFNFGQRAFANTAPTGFKALCTQNLPTPTIGATSNSLATQYFNPVLYTGTNATQSITTDFQPDWVWIKSRSTSSRNTIFDAVRGVTKVLWSDSTDAEGTASAGTGLTSLNSNGFTLGTEIAGTSGSTNVSGVTYVAWNWKANGTGSTNTVGTLTSTVSANPTSGFSIATYTGTSALASVGHGLGVAPSMVIAKGRSGGSASYFWAVWHRSVYATNQDGYLNMSSTNGTGTASGVWSTYLPTSSVFYVGGDTSTSGSAATYVAYCFAPVAGFSAFGSYTGNGSTDGVFVYTGFRPAYVMVKCSSSGGTDWVIEDSTRSTINVADARLFANTSDAESSNGNGNIDFLSNGFKLRNTHASMNASGSTYIYACFAQNPFKYSLAR